MLDISTAGPSKDWQSWHHTNQSHEKLNHFTPSKLYPEPIPRLIRLRGKAEDAASQLREKVNAAAIAAYVACMLPPQTGAQGIMVPVRTHVYS